MQMETVHAQVEKFAVVTITPKLEILKAETKRNELNVLLILYCYYFKCTPRLISSRNVSVVFFFEIFITNCIVEASPIVFYASTMKHN